MSKRDFPATAQEMWDILAKALMLRSGGSVTISGEERAKASDTHAEIELMDDGSIRFRVERH